MIPLVLVLRACGRPQACLYGRWKMQQTERSPMPT